MNSSEQEPTFIISEDCCDVWGKILHYFFWMQPEGSDIYMMPYLPTKDNKWRVNFCPSCGKERRECNIASGRLESKLRYKHLT